MRARLQQAAQWLALLALIMLYSAPVVLLAQALIQKDPGWAVLALVLAAGLGVFLLKFPFLLMAVTNRAADRRQPSVSAAAARLHGQLVACDLHADTFMWARDPLERSRWGHIDLPRMLEGHAGLVVFTATTSCPLGMNFESTPRSLDMITPLVMLQGWPFATWFSLKVRALHMLARMDACAAASNGQFMVVRWRDELETFLERRRRGARMVAALPGIQGVHCFEHHLPNVDELFHAGFRMAGLTHFFDNEAGGSAHGVHKGPLTDFGRAAVARMEALGMVIDLAHAAPRLIDDVLARATRPVVISHTGPKALHDTPRTVSDEHIRGVAATGGIIGVGFWKDVVGRPGIPAIVEGIAHIAEVAGVDHVALGSDYDGLIPAPCDISGLPRFTEALLNHGFPEDTVVKIMGGNVLRLLENTLPIKQ